MAGHSKTDSHNHIPLLIAFAKKHNLQQGKLHEVKVSHDQWCDIISGGNCNCKPDVSFLPTFRPENN